VKIAMVDGPPVVLRAEIPSKFGAPMGGHATKRADGARCARTGAAGGRLGPLFDLVGDQVRFFVAAGPGADRRCKTDLIVSITCNTLCMKGLALLHRPFWLWSLAV